MLPSLYTIVLPTLPLTPIEADFVFNLNSFLFIFAIFPLIVLKSPFPKPKWAFDFFGSFKTLARELPVALKIENGKLVPCEFLDKNVIYRGYIDACFVDLDEKIIEVNDLSEIPRGYELVEILEEWFPFF